MCDCQFDVMDTKKLTINQSQNAYLKLIYINRAHKCRTDLGNSTERTITRCVYDIEQRIENEDNN